MMAKPRMVVVQDIPRLGLENMAIDERLLQDVATGNLIWLGGQDHAQCDRLRSWLSVSDSPLIAVRFYSWSEPTFSLGHFQRIEQLGQADDTREHPSLGALPWVHRKTGGGAILHDRELTYSMVVPIGIESLSLSKGHNELLYRAVHHGVVEGLRALGFDAKLSESCTCLSNASKASDPFLCFHRRTPVDVIAWDEHGADHKVLGSAQRRVKTGLLQHGSFLIGKSRAYSGLLGLEDLWGLPAPLVGVFGGKSDWGDWFQDRVLLAIAGLLGQPEDVLRLNLREQSVRL
jgi:lipoate-protein ligase A